MKIENAEELKNYSMYRECKKHNWHGIKQANGPELYCKDCQIEALENRFRELAVLCNKTMKKIITSNVGCGDYKHNCANFNELAFKEAIKEKFGLEI